VAVAPRPAPRPASEDDAPAASSGGGCVASINARPWAEVYIDGKKAGITPLVDFELPCGKHKVILKNPDLGVIKNETIAVKAGEKFKKVFGLVDAEE
jgi:hypothetical protein